MTTDLRIDRRVAAGSTVGTSPLRWAQAALALGVACGIALAALLVFTTTTSEGSFKHTADYWLTANGIPFAIAQGVLLIAVHVLQRGRAGRLGTAGLVVNTLALIELIAQLSASLVLGEEVRWGPSYPLAAVATFVAVALFAAGSWRVGLLPRWMLAIWPLLTVVGSWAGVGPTPLLLSAFYVTSAVVLTRRAKA